LAILQQWKFAQNTYSKFYIDAWYLIVTQAENTPSTVTVDKHNAAKSDAIIGDYSI